MNLNKLKAAEENFFLRYPGGFAHPELMVLSKKHKMSKLTEMAQADFALSEFGDAQEIGEKMVKVVGQSSMVSMFEKPKFRDCIRSLDDASLQLLALGLKNILHGDQRQGFDQLVQVLGSRKLAKWALVTIIPNYFHPDTEVFIKPTTAKHVIDYFEIRDLHYLPRPHWAFYQDYRAVILDMKSKVDASLAPSNAAFSGFLMLSMQGSAKSIT